MKHLRLTAFFLLIVALIVPVSSSSFGQSTQQQPAQTPSLSPSSPQQTGDVSAPVESEPASHALASGSNTALPQRRFKLVPPKNSPKIKMLPDAPLVPGVWGQRQADLSGDAFINVLNRCFFLASSAQLAAQLGDGMQPAQPAGEAWRKPVIGKAVMDCDLFPIDGCVRRHGTIHRPPQPAQLEFGGPEVDPGIFLGSGRGSMCSSIVSYNFSPGDNPQLESVTTCTPAGWVTTYRAQGKNKKPPAPLFRTTVLSAPQR